MKNILMSIFTILLILLTIIVMVKGISIAGYNILSISQIIEKSDSLTQEIQDVTTLNNVNYKKALSDLNDATKKLTTAKSNYLDIASVSSDSEIKEANQEQIYSMEYLWSQIGNHATAEGVNLKLEVNSTGTNNENKLNFTVVGSYMGIRNFVYSLENDTDLNFQIENFKLVTGSGEEKLNCTFTVSSIKIKQETLTTSSSTTNSSTSTTSSSSNTTGNTTTSKTNSTTSNTTSDAASSIDNAVQ